MALTRRCGFLFFYVVDCMCATNNLWLSRKNCRNGVIPRLPRSRRTASLHFGKQLPDLMGNIMSWVLFPYAASNGSTVELSKNRHCHMFCTPCTARRQQDQSYPCRAESHRLCSWRCCRPRTVGQLYNPVPCNAIPLMKPSVGGVQSCILVVGITM